jgi:hypothetical protein
MARPPPFLEVAQICPLGKSRLPLIGVLACGDSLDAVYSGQAIAGRGLSGGAPGCHEAALRGVIAQSQASLGGIE